MGRKLTHCHVAFVARQEPPFIGLLLNHYSCWGMLVALLVVTPCKHNHGVHHHVPVRRKRRISLRRQNARVMNIKTPFKKSPFTKKLPYWGMGPRTDLSQKETKDAEKKGDDMVNTKTDMCAYSIHMYAYTTHTHANVQTHTGVHTHACTNTHRCTNTCMYKHTWMHTHTHTHMVWVHLEHWA